MTPHPLQEPHNRAKKRSKKQRKSNENKNLKNTMLHVKHCIKWWFMQRFMHGIKTL